MEEIFIDIYRSLILKSSFHKIESITKGSGAHGCIFEYAVIFNIIEKLKNGPYNLFNYFSISKNLTVKKFVLNKNELLENLIYKKQHLDEKDEYIIDQEVFCGKALDFIIINFKESNPCVYGFQVSIFKKEIYKIEDIKKSYESMKELLQKYFGISFNIYYMYFGYIFDFTQVKTSRYLIMLNKCKDENLKYCFYDPIKQQFKDEKGYQIKNVDNIVTPVFETNKRSYNSSTLDNFIIKYEPINIEEPLNGDNGLLNNNQKISLLNIIKSREGKNAEYKFIQKGNFDNLKVDKNHFCIALVDLIPLVIFFKKNVAYVLYNDGSVEETNKATFDNELYFYEIYYTENFNNFC